MISSVGRFKHVIIGAMESALVSIMRSLSYKSNSWFTRYVLILVGSIVDERGGSAVQACTLIVQGSFACALLSTLGGKIKAMKMIRMTIKTKLWVP